MITYSINVHPVIALMFSQTGTDVLPRRDEGSDKPSATIEPHRILVQTRTRTQAAGLKVRCRFCYTTVAHYIVDIVPVVVATKAAVVLVVVVIRVSASSSSSVVSKGISWRFFLIYGGMGGAMDLVQVPLDGY